MIQMVRPETWLVCAEVRLANDTNCGHTRFSLFGVDVEHHHTVVSGVGNEQTIAPIFIKNATGMIELRSARARSFRRKVRLTDDCDGIGRLRLQVRRFNVPDQDSVVGTVRREQTLVLFVKNRSIDCCHLIRADSGRQADVGRRLAEYRDSVRAIFHMVRANVKEQEAIAVPRDEAIVNAVVSNSANSCALVCGGHGRRYGLLAPIAARLSDGVICGVLRRQTIRIELEDQDAVSPSLAYKKSMMGAIQRPNFVSILARRGRTAVDHASDECGIIPDVFRP
jgi:hypothetical protein